MPDTVPAPSEQARATAAHAQREARPDERRDERRDERTAQVQQAQQREAAQRETSQRETSQREASQRETPQHETSQRETPQRETSQRETPQREMPQRESAQREMPQRDAVPEQQRPSNRLSDEWQAVQFEFVDDPKAAVRKADELVTRAIEELTSRHRSLSQQWKGDGDHETEDLRLALHRYRELFKSLVAVK
ncbi:hypothetical protein ACIA8G_33785 [Lentzea sp. NPDC051213]|uniref:hypothetical protein n=1 Tax=Lentzea sp. NPDC051213 TaxID=3364126 RepID=UPI003789A53B